MKTNIEADWVTGAGYRAVVVIHPAGHRCGYVAVPEGHKCHGKDYDDVRADVHGGLTYAGGNGEYPVEASGLWWLGYDCAHLGDARDSELMQGEYKEVYDKGLFREMHFEGDTVKTMEYCVNECESLAKQLSEAA
jgi:hypothetical protein